MNENTKIHDLIIDINPNKREKVINSRTQFFTMDEKTGEMSIQFTRQGLQFDLSDATVLVGFHFVDKSASKVIDSEGGSVKIIDATGGRCSIQIPSHVYGYEGEVIIHIYLKFENGQSLDCGVIATRFERSWLDEETAEMETVYVERFENLAREIRKRADDLQRLLDGVDSSVVRQAEFEEHKAEFNTHVNERNNPHGVTVNQIGAAPVSHSHQISQITGLQADLNSRLPSSSLRMQSTGTATGQFRIGDLLIQTGTVSVPGGSGSHTTAPVVFPSAYQFTPNIQVSLSTTVPGSSVQGLSLVDQTAWGFGARVLRANSTGTIVRWLAIGTTAEGGQG